VELTRTGFRAPFWGHLPIDVCFFWSHTGVELTRTRFASSLLDTLDDTIGIRFSSDPSAGMISDQDASRGIIFIPSRDNDAHNIYSMETIIILHSNIHDTRMLMHRSIVADCTPD
jgi:hypothetical protein